MTAKEMKHIDDKIDDIKRIWKDFNDVFLNALQKVVEDKEESIKAIIEEHAKANAETIKKFHKIVTRHEERLFKIENQLGLSNKKT